MKDATEEMMEYARFLDENGINVWVDKVRLILQTEKVWCRFIPGRLYFYESSKFAGIRVDEVFGLDEIDTAKFRRGGTKDQFRGTALTYIYLMEKLVEVKSNVSRQSD